MSNHISSHKCPWNLFNFEALSGSAHWRVVVKRGRLISKSGIIHMKFQNLLIFFFPNANLFLNSLSNYHYDIYSYILQNYQFSFLFYVDHILIPYAFLFNYGSIMVRFLINSAFCNMALIRWRPLLATGAYSDLSVSDAVLNRRQHLLIRRSLVHI